VRGTLFRGPAGVVLVVLALSACTDDQPPFCDDLRSLRPLISDLRERRAEDDIPGAAPILDDLAEAYQAIRPPDAIAGDWVTAIDFFRYFASEARAAGRGDPRSPVSPTQDRLYDEAFTRITDYGVAECDAERGYLVPP
jgi:hypothetical protein